MHHRLARGTRPLGRQTWPKWPAQWTQQCNKPLCCLWPKWAHFTLTVCVYRTLELPAKPKSSIAWLNGQRAPENAQKELAKLTIQSIVYIGGHSFACAIGMLTLTLAACQLYTQSNAIEQSSHTHTQSQTMDSPLSLAVSHLKTHRYTQRVAYLNLASIPSALLLLLDSSLVFKVIWL